MSILVRGSSNSLPQIDSTPVANSTNLVTSGGVYTAIADTQDDIDNLADGTYSGGTFINNTTISAPTINGATAQGTWNFSSATVTGLTVTAVFG